MICVLSGKFSFSINQPIARLDQIILLDVQGLGGGGDLWITYDGAAFCRIVKPPVENKSGLQETRYSFTISDKQRRRLLKLFNENHFCTMLVKDRYGLPDESRPTIYIRTDITKCCVAKWLNDNKQNFDPIYKYLLNLVEQGGQGTIIGKGTYDRQWKPDSFPENQAIYEMGLPLSLD